MASVQKKLFLVVFAIFSSNILCAEVEITCAIIKPDAVAAGKTGAIITKIEDAGFSIVRLDKIMLPQEAVEAFYQEHEGKPFFNNLVAYMSSGPIVVMALEKEDAVNAWRTMIGATDPGKAKKGTIRKLYGTDVTHNAVHGSDSQDKAIEELLFFFVSDEELQDELDDLLLVDELEASGLEQDLTDEVEQADHILFEQDNEL